MSRLGLLIGLAAAAVFLAAQMKGDFGKNVLAHNVDAASHVPPAVEETSERVPLSATSVAPRGAPFPPDKTKVPARMIENPEPVLPETVQGHIENGWYVSDRRNGTFIAAGASALSPNDGLFVIVRESYEWARQRIQVVEVPGSGSVHIVTAPLQPNRETWSQTHGVVTFRGRRGIAGVLEIASGRTNLRPGSINEGVQ